MSANTVNNQLYLAQAQTADPGASGTISVEKSLSVCNLVSAGAESRTLGRPLREGVELTLHMKTDGGDITLTVTGGLNEGGDTTYVFTDAGQFISLRSFFDGTDYYWRKYADHATDAANASFTNASIGTASITNASIATRLTFADNASIATNASNGTRIGTATTQKIGLWNATPIVQPSSTGELIGTLGMADTTDNATNMNSNGNSGTKRYTFNDLVKHLKAAGILAAS